MLLLLDRLDRYDRSYLVCTVQLSAGLQVRGVGFIDFHGFFFFKVLLCRQCCRQEGGFLATIFAKVVDLPGKINSVKAIGLECGLDEATQTLLYYFCPRANLPYTIEGFL